MPTKLIGFYVIFGFGIKGCSDILVPTYLRAASQLMSIVPSNLMDANSCYSFYIYIYIYIYIKATTPLLVTRPIHILNTVSRVSEFALHDKCFTLLKV